MLQIGFPKADTSKDDLTHPRDPPAHAPEGVHAVLDAPPLERDSAPRAAPDRLDAPPAAELADGARVDVALDAADEEFARRLLHVAEIVTFGALVLLVAAAVLASRFNGDSLQVHALPF